MLIKSIRDPDYLEYLLRDGSRQLTANWDAGAFSIEALGFIHTATTLPTPLNGKVVMQSSDNRLYLARTI